MRKAAIVANSLGTSFNTGDGVLSVVRDADKDLQILLIGACIIDGSTADNDLTVISEQGGGALCLRCQRPFESL